jgi:hypothetical protein
MPLGKTRKKWKDGVKIYLRETDYEDVSSLKIGTNGRL